MKFYTHEITIGGVTVPLRCYIPDVCGRTSYAGKRPAVVIFPGGGYSFTYSGEAEPIAMKYAADGICAFILDYSCTPVHFPIPQLQAFSAVRYVREHAEEFGIRADNIATTGFSAGGHLCSCTGTLWNKFDKWFKEYGMDDVDCHMYRPDKLILCYPVIKSTTRFSHSGSIINLLGEEQLKDETLVELVSTEKQIDAETPPTFIWHTSEDTGVPIRNTLDFAAGVSDLGIPCEIHIFLHGGHGLCLGTCVTDDRPFGEPHETSEWIYKAIRFAYDEDIIKKA
ncbi:MAG: alpha/beta hydrolase [Clostridia bacterium]|nr:alpha/beta hydrolase [Clostridia bacterium]